MQSLIPAAGSLLISLLVSGCGSSPASRINEKPAVYQSLTLDQREKVAAGQVEVGFTADMVYLALGKPSDVRTATETASARVPGPANGASGRPASASPVVAVAAWTYTNYMPPPPPRPKTKGAPGISKSRALANWSDNTLPSGGSQHGDFINLPRGSNYDQRGPSAMPPLVYTLKILFRDGQVAAIKLAN